MTNQTEIIKDAYGEYWEQVKDFIDENGWISLYRKDWGDLTPRVSKMDIQHSGLFWRLDSLRSLPDVVIFQNLKTD